MSTEEKKTGTTSVLREGIRSGLLAFIIYFALALIISSVAYLVIGQDKIEKFMIGSLSDDGGTMAGRIIKSTAVLINFTLFQSAGKLKLGILLLIIIPFIVFFCAKSKLLKRGITLYNAVIMIISSFVFVTIDSLFSLVTKGMLLGFNMNFFSLKNALWTFFLVFVLQAVIVVNYNRQALGFVKALRVLMRLQLFAGLVIGLIELFKVFGGIGLGLGTKVAAILGLAPNVAVYKAFTMIGNDLDMGYTVNKLFEKISGIQLSFSGLSVAMKIASILLFVILVVIAILSMKKEHYWKNLMVFAITYPVLNIFLAYCTTIRIVWSDIEPVRVSFNYLMIVLVPVVVILVLGLVIWLIRKMKDIISEV